MHPAYSVIAFTTLSGAGFGLGFFLSLGVLPLTQEVGIAAWGSVFALIISGLIASLVHLKQPQRFILALTQWRSSWLSREAVLALATLVPFAICAFGWIVYGVFWWVAGLAGAILATATVYATAMIYASLKPIRHWAHPVTPFLYLGFALSNGAGLFLVLGTWSMRIPSSWILTTGLAIVFAMLTQMLWWISNDNARSSATIGSATGLARFGKVKELTPPHTQENYVQKEMGFRIARKHRLKLRFIATLLGLVMPLLFLALAYMLEGLWGILFPMAAAAHFIATLITRWLFFAEARHTAMLYYGEERT